MKKLKGETIRVRYFQQDERENLLNACADGPWYLHPIVEIAMNTGMRMSEIMKLQWQDVDTQNKIIHVNTSKTGKRRDIPMNEILIALFKSMEQTGPTVFPQISFRRAWITAVKKARLQDFHFHDLRHEFASQLIMRNVNMKVVQELLGHSSIHTTMRYAHLASDARLKAVEQLAEVYRKPKDSPLLQLVTNA